ncbi:MAG: GNAT family N-acetyltransferase [Candidatus Thorarchaeota archaeon]
MTEEDAVLLAECLTSFNDSDSWPGGFNQGNPFSAEDVLEFKQTRDDIRVIVAYEGEKIVGHCDVCQHNQDLEAAYVGLLGVNPAFQGKGYGKAMLIEAAETAAKAGFRRIDLHTWAGNLKAMPLYKRVGYMWFPNTRVLMESHIPGIINNPLFQEFFERYYWFDSFKPAIKQEPDDIVEEGIGIFKYHFEGDNGDAIDVIIDREAKGMCGFSLTIDGVTISAKVVPERHTGYIAVGEYPFEFKVSNSGDEELSFSATSAPSESFIVKMDDEFSGVLSPGEEKNLRGTYAISNTAKHIDRETNPDDKVKTQVEWALSLGESDTKLYSGLIPVAAISLSLGPSYPCLSPGESQTIGLGFQNNTEGPITGAIELAAPSTQDLGVETIEFTLSAHEHAEQALLIVANVVDAADVITIKATVFVGNKDERILVDEREVKVPIIGAAGAIAYEAINDRIVIENDQLRATMSSKPPMYFREIKNKIMGQEASGWFLLPDLGYPFPSEGGEWDRKDFDVKITNRMEYAQIELEGDSTDRPGLRYRITHRLYPGRGYIETSVFLKNLGTETYTNLGVKVAGWVRYEAPELYVPLRGRIYLLESAEWTGDGQLPRKPKEYHEQWIATRDLSQGSVMGFIFDSDDIAAIRPRRSGFTAVEYNLPDLGPGESVEKSVLHLVMSSGSWQDVRALWARLNGISIDRLEPSDLRSDLEVSIVPSGVDPHPIDGSPIFIDLAKSNELELGVFVIHETPIDVDIKVRMSEGLLVNGKRELELDPSTVGIDQPLKKRITVDAERLDDWLRRDGEIELKFGSRIERSSLSAVVYDSKIKAESKMENIEGLHLHTLLSGGWQIAVSPDYAGSLVRFGKEGQSIFHDIFPRTDPFIWWDRYFSGLNPWIQAWGVWDWETAFWKETWTVSEKEIGSWKGFELTTDMKHSPGLKGMEFSVQFMFLSGVPLVHAHLTARNLSSQWKRFNYGLRGTARPGGQVQNLIHCIVSGRRVIYEPTEGRARFLTDPRHGWAGFVDSRSDQTLGAISTLKTKTNLHALNIGRDAQRLLTQVTIGLHPNEEATFSSYLTILEDVEDLRLLTNLPKDIQ